MIVVPESTCVWKRVTGHWRRVFTMAISTFRLVDGGSIRW
jgi:hypothetical protein